MRTLQEWLNYLGWSQADLAREAGINQHTAGKAVSGDTVTPRIARAIAQAISRSAGEMVQPGDIRGLMIGR